MPIVDDAIGGYEGTAAQLVALMENRLQSVSAFSRQLAGEEQIIEDDEIGVDDTLDGRALVGIGQRQQAGQEEPRPSIRPSVG